eukprot:367909_1
MSEEDFYDTCHVNVPQWITQLTEDEKTITKEEQKDIDPTDIFYSKITPNEENYEHGIVDDDNVIHKFHFQFKLSLKYKQSVYIYKFESDFHRIKSLHQIADLHRKKYFMGQCFPLLFQQSYESHQALLELIEKRLILNDSLSLRDKKISWNDSKIKYKKTYICKGPGTSGFWGSKRTPNANDMKVMCNTLNTLFSSPLFAKTDYLYNELGFKNQTLIYLIKSIAHLWSKALRKHAKSSKNLFR